ncbi:MAG: hypothetical protein ISR95_06690 [Candidatus Marinimicrobia bacterium]|nr:hypothetical protein [Candidatus Neomarinimicrobiota bacterium]
MERIRIEEVYTIQQIPWWIWYFIAGFVVLFRSLSIRLWSYDNRLLLLLVILPAVVVFWPIAIIIWIALNWNCFLG